MSSTARLGAFIVVALLILALATFMLGNRQFLFSRTYRLTAQFDNVAGLDEGAPVRAGGVRIGTVRRIVLPGQPGDKVTTELQLEDSTRNVIRKDSTASVETEWRAHNAATKNAGHRWRRSLPARAYTSSTLPRCSARLIQ